MSGLSYVKGDILKTTDDVLVNTVNTRATMGKGLALQVKNKWPEVFASYKKTCAAGRLKVGDYCVYHFQCIKDPPYCVFNMTTKDDYKDKSQYYYIAFGLQHLAYFIREWDYDSVSIPAIGCGNGELCWEKVKKIIDDWYESWKTDPYFCYTDINVYLPLEVQKRLK